MFVKVLPYIDTRMNLQLIHSAEQLPFRWIIQAR
jgi:hypothetical protein